MNATSNKSRERSEETVVSPVGGLDALMNKPFIVQQILFHVGGCGRGQKVLDVTRDVLHLMSWKAFVAVSV